MEIDQSWTTLAAGLTGGLGFGATLTALIQHRLHQRAKAEETMRIERKEAFVSLLAALAEGDKLRGDSTPEFEVRYALCVAHVQLVASKQVLDLLDTCRDPEPNTTERNSQMRALITAMRRDLGIAKD